MMMPRHLNEYHHLKCVSHLHFRYYTNTGSPRIPGPQLVLSWVSGSQFSTVIPYYPAVFVTEYGRLTLNKEFLLNYDVFLATMVALLQNSWCQCGGDEVVIFGYYTNTAFAGSPRIPGSLLVLWACHESVGVSLVLLSFIPCTKIDLCRCLIGWVYGWGWLWYWRTDKKIFQLFASAMASDYLEETGCFKHNTAILQVYFTDQSIPYPSWLYFISQFIYM